MNALLTLLGFVLVTGLFAWFHVRGQSKGVAVPRETKPCPRCHKPVPKGEDFCPSCQAPLQAFEIVSAPLARADAGAADGPKHALVRSDVCVGCGTCVDACPEPGAITLVNKLAIVNLDLCKGHGSCATACPVNGIVVTSGAAVQQMEVPELDVNFQSNVPGLYIVGELGGRGLIKNAVNEGRLAMEHVSKSLLIDPFRGRSDDGIVDVIVVGSGPAGLSAALEALKQGLTYVVLEQGTLIDTIAKYPRQKLLLAEPVRTPLYGNLWVADSSKEELIAVWQNVIDKSGLKVNTEERVTAVAKDGGVFRVTTVKGEHRARRVVLAMGRRGTPRKLGVPGEQLDKVFYDIVEMEAFEGQRMLVVGGGDSALESALGLANQEGTTVTLSYRGSSFDKAKERNRTKIDAAVTAGKVELLLESQVKEIRRDVVVLEHEGTLRLLPNDFVVVRVGGEAPYPFLERMGVRIVRKEVAIETGEGSGAGSAHA